LNSILYYLYAKSNNCRANYRQHSVDIGNCHTLWSNTRRVNDKLRQALEKIYINTEI
jgi:hypothetical protein